MKNEIQIEGDKSAYVQGMFSRIAPHYDLMNRLMTGGQDLAWRREVIRRAELFPGARLLDLGAGTGDLAREALRQQPQVNVLAADFTLGMMQAGKKRYNAPARWSAADALALPFADAQFDALVSGYLLRNVSDLDQALSEQLRVLKPGGVMVTLDTTRPPAHSLLTPFIRFHMRYVIPFLGGLISGQREAYTYLPSSSEGFLSAEELAARMSAAGFTQTGFHRRMFGTMAIHWGRKPAQ
jgi:demethylmenaquinone methyltransferase/2-methoxy-6-polyprenyl-1,4-benzoquinol methylase